VIHPRASLEQQLRPRVKIVTHIHFQGVRPVPMSLVLTPPMNVNWQGLANQMVHAHLRQILLGNRVRLIIRIKVRA